MSAIPLTTYRIGPARASRPDPVVDFDKLIPIADAAALMGLQEGSLRRLCGEKLHAQGDAFLVTPPAGGQKQWFVHRRHHPSLRTPEEASRHLPADLSRFTAKQRDQAMQRRVCVDRLRLARMTPGGKTMNQLAAQVIESAGVDFPALKVSRSRLYEWDKRYACPADLWKLVDSRGGDRASKADPLAWEAFKDLFLHQNQPTVRHCWKEVEKIAGQNGWGWCSYAACVRQLNERIAPQLQAYHRTPATWRQQSAPFTQQHPESWKAGELWIGDHKELDLICTWGKTLIRPWLTAWMDWRTRKLAGWVLSDNPNSSTILAALGHGLDQPSNMGGPAHVWIDNGKDYDAWIFHGQTKQQRRAKITPNVDEAKACGIFSALKIDPHFAIAYSPNGKARLERWFRTLEGFAKTFETFTGDSIENKPERLNEILARPRLIPSFELVYRRIATHITGVNARTDHAIEDLADGGETISPDEAFARWCDTKRVMVDPASRALLLQHWQKPAREKGPDGKMTNGRLTVGRNGVAINLCGRTLHYGHTEQALHPFKALAKEDRPTINVSYDPHDLKTIRVYDEQFRYVCTATMNEMGGLAGRIDRNHVATSMRNKSSYTKALDRVAEYSLTSTLTPEEQVAEVMEAERRQAPMAQPSALQIVQTPVDGQSEQIAQAEFRKVVGGNESSPPTRRGLRPLRHISGPARQGDGPRQLNPLDKLRERNHEW